jgi:dUTPase
MLKVINGGKMSTKGSKFSACVDLYANETICIGVGETKIVGLGVAIDMDYIVTLSDEHYPNYCLDEFLKSHYFQLMLRSSLGKKGLIIPNGVGIIDIDYKDEIKMIIHNPIAYVFNEENPDLSLKTYSYSDREGLIIESYEIKKGERIAQIMLKRHETYIMGINTDDERNGGFGSTGER